MSDFLHYQEATQFRDFPHRGLWYICIIVFILKKGFNERRYFRVQNKG
jgi:hypothetical protein